MVVYIIPYSLKTCVHMYCDIFKEEGCGSGPGSDLFNIFRSEVGGCLFEVGHYV